MSRKIAAALAVVTALSLSGCKSDDSKSDSPFKGNDSDRSQIIDKAVKANKDKPIPSSDAKIDGEVKLKIKEPSNSYNIDVDGKVKAEYDADSGDASASFKGKVKVPGKGFTNDKMDLQGYAHKAGSVYDLYGSMNGMWVKTTTPSKNIDSALNKVRNSNPSAIPSINPSNYANNDYADVKVSEKGDNYVIKVTPKDKVIDRLITSAQRSKVNIDKKSIKASLELEVDKKSYALNSLDLQVEGKTTDGSASVDGSLKLKIDRKANVTIKLPDAAKNAQPLSGSRSTFSPSPVG